MRKPFAKIMSIAAMACAVFATIAAPLHAEDAAQPAPTPTLEQRVGVMEAYFTNSDPREALKDKDGKIPKGLTTAAIDLPGPGHNAWMMTSAALVLFMTLPGLALFYGGLVRKKNVLSVCAQCLGCAGMVTVLWWAFGYSLVFGTNFNNGIFGGSEYFFLKGVNSAPNANYSFWVSQNVFAMFQLMFAIITPALIVGAIAERMKYSAIMLFILVWMFLVYFPMAHMVWGATGFMNGTSNGFAGIKALDFAGGTVVHMTSGWSALVLCLVVGKRFNFGKVNMAPHSLVLTVAGTAMLWVGWYGFNAGSALGSDGVAASAFMNTTLAAATAGFTWALIELVSKKHASILGFCSGIVAGLVVITPACGYVSASGSMLIGVLAAAVPYIFVVFVKARAGYDDALDTFGVHAVGGTLGAILTGFLALQTKFANGMPNPESVNPHLADNMDAVINKGALVFEQLKAVGVTLAFSVIGTIIIAFFVKFAIGLRPSFESENNGLDLTDHREEGYVL
jgi:ammonium transporter, Amt family